jgi:hypothetical protein
MGLVDLALVAALDMALCGIAAPLPEATTSIASGLADTSFSAWAVTLVSERAKRSVATTLMPFFSAWR